MLMRNARNDLRPVTDINLPHLGSTRNRAHRITRRVQPAPHAGQVRRTPR